jgi:glyoxylase-like metal-dependent hydrolase (beta-lactamase superfamily II)
MAPRLNWELFIRTRPSSTQGIPPGREKLDWVANTATLIWGERDAALIDTFLSDQQSAELADWIESKGRVLRKVYLTHGHPDHFFGLTKILARFPQARALARPNVVKVMQFVSDPDFVAKNLVQRWPGQVPPHLTVAEPLDGDSFELEGNELRIIDTGHTDTNETTGIHIPSLEMVVAGDAIYNETHPYLGESDHNGRQAWLAAIDKIAALTPKVVVVGHGPVNPDNSPRHIAATRQYILDFDRLDDETTTPIDLYQRMLALYPDRINPGSLWGASHAAKQFRGKGPA